MKPTLLHGKHQKWLLSFALIGALGFSISMDPVNNQLARHQQIHETNLATTAPEIKEVTARTASLQVAGQGNETFQVNIAEIDGKAQATFMRLQTGTVAQGADCQLCGETRALTKNLSDIEGLRGELVSIINTQTEVEERVVQTPGKATAVNIEEWAKKCVDKDDEEKLSCHTEQLIKLSKHLANESAQASLVYEYYREYVYSDLRAGFRASPYSSLYQELYNESYDSYLRLFEELRGKNGKTVRDHITRLHAASYSDQARHGQQLVIDGLTQTRPDLMNAGYWLINRLNGLANQAQAFHQSAVYDIEGLSRHDQMGLFDTTRLQMSQVSRMLQDLLMAKDIKTHQIPMLAGDHFPVQPNSGSILTTIPGSDTLRLEEMLRARAAANGVRNSGLGLPTGQQGVPFNRNARTQ